MKKIGFVFLLSLFLSGIAFADTGTYSGTNVGGQSWVRPFADGSCCSGLGPVLYHVERFTISANDTCTISSVQNGYDGYLFLYTSPFDALNQVVNFIAGDDDGSGGIGTSEIPGTALTANTVYQVVTTGFAAGEEGTFTNTITCPSATVTIGRAKTSVPTLSEWGMMLLGVLMLGLVAREHRRRA